MRQLPTDRHIREYFNQLRRFAGIDPDEKRPKPSTLDQAEAVMLAALARSQRAGANNIDGFSASNGVGGGRGSGSYLIVEDDDEKVSVPVTAVESSAIRRMAGRLPDPNDDVLRGMLAQLEMMVGGKNTLVSQAGAWANITADLEDDNVRRCHPCSKAGIEHGYELKRVRVGDVSFDVCLWAYKFFREVGEFPSPKQCREHDERGYTRRRVDPTQLIPMVS